MEDSDPHPVTEDLRRNQLAQSRPALTEHPGQIGRYRIEKVLGQGGFGVVYLAKDEQLGRRVAIKVPHARLLSRAEDAEAYLAEARTVAGLDHPGIVPVYDVGSTRDCPCFVVSKYIEGSVLADRIKNRRLSHTETAELVATVAEALHYAHKQGVVHRDVKPGNILIDSNDKAYVVDFGLALREENIGKVPTYAGTPMYMSPEQARGEGHRVDGRSDVFSLGVVLYELLIGRRPFQGGTKSELLKQVSSYEPRPLRQYDETLPKELERICYKAIAKRASERYWSAYDFATDLRYFLSQQTTADSRTQPDVGSSVGRPEAAPTAPSAVVSSPASSGSLGTDSFSARQPIKIVPKGLRSFDAHDADFFLELLPGPRDREGLPDSLRFWKHRMEETDPDSTFPVGLIYGPSGCGKSSLVKAGLLPRLSEHVVAIYVEATSDQTETRLLHRLRKHFPELSVQRSLKETLAALRRGQGIAIGKKVVIVLDQFEQWLHAKNDQENSNLLQALRQCDGGRVQCVVMVRDDFWLAVSRFMRQLEVPLIEGDNTALVDLFDMHHSRKVLAAFAPAFGRLPENPRDVSAQQKAFLEQAVAGLAREGKVACVRLALFAEMMKSKDWTPDALKEVGGTTGVGVTFLEESFSGITASPQHRYHQEAARSVLQALLPESGSDLKGHMRSYDELLQASGYGNHPEDFQELMRILDSDFRLITPMDPESSDRERAALSESQPSRQFYQLAHDYLVHSLRDWLTREQRQTRRGRAELRLAERSSEWDAKPETRNLPTWWGYLSIRLFTTRQKWNESQRKMMRSAGRYYGVRCAVVFVLLLIAAIVGLGVRNAFVSERARILADNQERQNDRHARGLLNALLTAETRQVPAIIEEIGQYRRWADPLLEGRFREAEDGSTEKLHIALAMLPADASKADYLQRQLVLATPSQFPTVRDALLPMKEDVARQLWTILANREHDSEQRFQAACALASYDPDDQRWSEYDLFAANQLVSSLPSHLAAWRNALRPAKRALLEPLAVIYRDSAQQEQRRVFAADVLADFASDQPDVLFDLLADSEQAQFPILLAKLRAHRSRALQLARAELARQPAVDWEHTVARDDWPQADAGAVREIESGGGIFHERFAMTQTMPLEKFASVAEELREAGYRPIRLRPYATAASVQVAAIWKRDGGQWQMIHDAPRDRLAVEDSQQRREGWVPVDVAGYMGNSSDGQRWCALWEQSAVPRAESVRLVIMPDEEQLTADGFVPQTWHVSVGPTRRTVHSGIWIKSDATWMFARSLRPSRFETLPSHHLDCDVSVYHTAQRSAADSGVQYALLQRANLQMVAVEVHGLDPQQHLVRCQQLAEDGYQPVAISVAGGEENAPLVTASIWHRPRVEEETKERLAIRQANAAVLLMKFDKPDAAWALLRHRPDPRTRSYLLHWLGLQGVDPAVLIDRLAVEKDDSIRRALVLSLGSYDDTQLPAKQRTDLLVELWDLYENCPDPGLHAASGWLLRKWNQTEKLNSLNETLRIDEAQLRSSESTTGHGWYLNTQGQTMVVLDSGEFLMGAPAWEPNRSLRAVRHRQRVEHRFAISATNVTLEQYSLFQPKGVRVGSRPIDEWVKTEDSPHVAMTWHEAAAYCNWLSEAEGIAKEQWCYEPLDPIDGKIALKPKDGFRQLTGYRLPTEAEWEYACRAGAETFRHYGNAEDLLSEYAWHLDNSQNRTWPVGSLKPNDFGLFDMLGNVWDWCHAMDLIYQINRTAAVGEPIELDSLDPTIDRVVRGGSFDTRYVDMRCAHRSGLEPFRRLGRVGFRIARTMP